MSKKELQMIEKTKCSYFLMGLIVFFFDDFLLYILYVKVLHNRLPYIVKIRHFYVETYEG